MKVKLCKNNRSEVFIVAQVAPSPQGERVDVNNEIEMEVNEKILKADRYKYLQRSCKQ